MTATKWNKINKQKKNFQLILMQVNKRKFLTIQVWTKHFNSCTFREQGDILGVNYIYSHLITPNQKQQFIKRVHLEVQTPNKPSVTDCWDRASHKSSRCERNPPKCPSQRCGPAGRHTARLLEKCTWTRQAEWLTPVFLLGNLLPDATSEGFLTW